MMDSNKGALGVSLGVILILGGLKYALWPWILRRRAWGRRSED